MRTGGSDVYAGGRLKGLSWELAGTAGLMGKGLFFEFIKHLPMEGKNGSSYHTGHC